MTSAGQASKQDLFHTALGELWHANPIVAEVAALCDDCGNRFAGSESERLGRDWLLKRFADAGLDGVHLEPYQYVGWKRGTCSFDVLSPRRRAIPAISLALAPSTPSGGLEGELIFLGQGRKADFDEHAAEIPGKFVAVTSGSPLGQIIHRGPLALGLHSGRVARKPPAGAAGRGSGVGEPPVVLP